MNAGQARLVYAPRFFGALYASFGDAGIIAIVAHEFDDALDPWGRLEVEVIHLCR